MKFDDEEETKGKLSTFLFALAIIGLMVWGIGADMGVW